MGAAPPLYIGDGSRMVDDVADRAHPRENKIPCRSRGRHVEIQVARTVARALEARISQGRDKERVFDA